MRRRWLGTVLAASTVTGCSLLFSTGDLAGEGAVAPDASDQTDASDASADGVVALADGSPEGSPDAAPGDPSLIGYWMFDETSGTSVADKSGHGHDAVLVGASFDPSGYKGGALLVGATGSAVVPSLSGAAFPPSGTLSIWFKYTFAPDDQEQRGVFDLYDLNRSHVFIRRVNGVAVPGQFQLAIQPKSPSGGYSYSKSFPATQNVWCHIVVAWNTPEKVGAAYVNGTALGRAEYSSAIPQLAPTDQDFRLGVNFIGAIDEVRLYDRELPAAEALVIP